MLPKGALAPDLKPGQVASIEKVLHGLRHGAVTGKGTARGVLLADEQGTGKTAVSVVAANVMQFRRVLIVCPASLRAVWDTQIRIWQTRYNLIYHLTASNIGLYAPDFLPNLRSGWVIINYDIVHKYPGLKDSPWDLLICDEAIALKSYQARRTTAVFGGRYNRKRVEPIEATKYLLLSGTPMPNRIEEIATLVEVLDPDNWSFKQLIQECYDENAEFDRNRRVDGYVDEGKLHILQHKLRSTVMVRCLKEDVLPNLPPKSYETALVPLKWSSVLGMEFGRMKRSRLILMHKLRRAKGAIREALQAELQGLQETMAHMAGASSFKIDAVVEFLLAQTEKVVVFAYHRELIEEYAEQLRQAGRGVVTLTGSNTRHTKEVVEAFQTNPRIQYFIGNMKVAGQGITLTVSCLSVFAELDWSLGVMEQAEDRVHRIGQAKPVRIVYFVLQGSLDPIMVDALHRKAALSRKALNPPDPPKLVQHKPRLIK